jgi:hypothetical protein
MLYQLSYASPKPFQESIQCADTLLFSAYHGTEIKVSIAAEREQTPKRRDHAPHKSFISQHSAVRRARFPLPCSSQSSVAQSAFSLDHSGASNRVSFHVL